MGCFGHTRIFNVVKCINHLLPLDFESLLERLLLIPNLKSNPSMLPSSTCMSLIFNVYIPNSFVDYSCLCVRYGSNLFPDDYSVIPSPFIKKSVLFLMI